MPNRHSPIQDFVGAGNIALNNRSRLHHGATGQQSPTNQNVIDTSHDRQHDRQLNGAPDSPFVFSHTCSTRSNNPGVSRTSHQDAASPHSPGTGNDRRHEHRTQNFVSPAHHAQSWRHQRSPLSNNPVMGVNQMSHQVVSPSVSYDGIFEPGSTYADLFHELRSHVFRTAAHPEPSSFDGNNSVMPNAGASASYSMSEYGVTTSDITPQRHGEGQDESTTSFDLPPAQEYVLWKAWTEEVSSWVCPSHKG